MPLARRGAAGRCCSSAVMQGLLCRSGARDVGSSMQRALEGCLHRFWAMVLAVQLPTVLDFKSSLGNHVRFAHHPPLPSMTV